MRKTKSGFCRRRLIGGIQAPPAAPLKARPWAAPQPPRPPPATMPMNILQLVGESAWSLATNIANSSDGSFIAVQTSKGSYTAGESLQGVVVLQNNSPRQINRVLVRISCKEKTYWDEEIARTIEEGEGEHRRSRTVYEHHQHSGRVTHMKDIIVVSTIAHMLGPGNYSYPFSYNIRADLPGCASFSKTWRASDPNYRNQLRMSAEVTYKVKAFVDVAGLFARDLSSKQALAVNPIFDWNTMKPAFGAKEGQVLLMCCIPRGKVYLQAAFDRAAYTAGETAQIKAQIKNDSEQKIAHMRVKLMRFITVRANNGRSHSLTDTMCEAVYEGVEPKSTATRDMPLPLTGFIQPGTKACVSYHAAPRARPISHSLTALSTSRTRCI